MDRTEWEILQVIDRAVVSPKNPKQSTWTWAARFHLAREITEYVKARDASMIGARFPSSSDSPSEDNSEL